MKAAAEIVDPEVRKLADEATRFVEGFRWCDGVTGCALAFAIAGAIGVFRIELRPAGEADPIVWVLTGDLPPAYLAYEDGETWQDALRGYVAEMQAWVEAAESGQSVADLIPVNVAPSKRYAEMLASRLEFIRRNLLDVNVDSLESDV